MKRAFILVMDSFGIGASADAGGFGDAGADTLGHIAAACAHGEADLPGRRRGRLRLPNLARLGLGFKGKPPKVSIFEEDKPSLPKEDGESPRAPSLM